MKTTVSRATLVLAMLGLGGCSGSDESHVSELPVAETLAAAAANPTLTATPGSAAAITSSATAGMNGATNGTAHGVEPFRNPFAPPKDPPPPPIVEEPEPVATEEPTPEVRQPGVPPKIRLLGFMNIGEPKVLVSFHNELETLAIGDTLEDMKVIKIQSPDVTMLFDEREINLSLFDQSWRHKGDQTSAGNNSRAPTRPRSTRPTRDTSGSASGGATPGKPARKPSGIPGFAPNAGKPPGFQTPASSGAGSTSGPLIGSPPPGLPGLTGKASGGVGIGGSDLPGVPGIDVDADGAIGGGDLPALPGGL